MLVQKALESEYTADGYGHGEKKRNNSWIFDYSSKAEEDELASWQQNKKKIAITFFFFSFLSVHCLTHSILRLRWVSRMSVFAEIKAIA